MPPIKVSGRSDPHKVAGAIAGEIKTNGRVEVHGMGMAAVYKAVMAISVARRYVASTGMDLICTPGMDNTNNDQGEERTFVKFIVEPRR